jgi:hypothetical protein
VNDSPIREWDEKVTTIYGLVIPHNSTLNPWSVELGKFRLRSNASLRLGIFISTSCNATDNISRIVHEWDPTSQNSNLTHSSIWEHEVDQPQRLLALDEDTGRSVHFGHSKMNVVDIVVAG